MNKLDAQPGDYGRRSSKQPRDAHPTFTVKIMVEFELLNVRERERKREGAEEKKTMKKKQKAGLTTGCEGER